MSSSPEPIAVRVALYSPVSDANRRAAAPISPSATTDQLGHMSSSLASVVVPLDPRHHPGLTYLLSDPRDPDVPRSHHLPSLLLSRAHLGCGVVVRVLALARGKERQRCVVG
ncbi:hypothetical protein D9611_010071 [Ephemerocybe angulata]|uniref:Uncharacterized protein n=1 Tax=Ephemerocybe angulata TaxID=980116 RepID=A0A8H5AZ96_9AGAR|nr:hypothetical protein D9611_010071 [Tulosesus angulatus]